MGKAAGRTEPRRPDPVASVVVPVYGPRHLLDACVAALRANTAEGPVELVLVNNGPSLSGWDPGCGVRLVENAQNLGFARASNQGAEIATGPVLVFLNVDTEVRPGWLAPLLEVLEDPGVAIAGARLVYPDGRLQHAGVDVWHGEALVPSNRQTERDAEDVDAVTGACMALRSSTFKELGGFDEGYWNGAEDVDLCLTARSLGYRVRYEPASVVVHHESATGPERWAAVGENLARLSQRWSSAGVR